MESIVPRDEMMDRINTVLCELVKSPLSFTGFKPGAGRLQGQIVWPVVHVIVPKSKVEGLREEEVLEVLKAALLEVYERECSSTCK